MIIDSWYDAYVGVVMLVRVVDGRLAKGDRIKLMVTGAVHEADEIGLFVPEMTAAGSLGPGEVGYMISSIKEVAEAKVGDTVTWARGGATEPLPGYREPHPVERGRL